MYQISEQTNLWEDFFIISSNKKTDTIIPIETDKMVASKLNSIDIIIECNSFFAWNQDMQGKMPETKTKFNQILNNYISEKGVGVFPGWFISSMSAWFDDNTRDILLNKWLEDETAQQLDLPWLLKYAEQDSELYLKVFKKLVKSYKDDKSQNRINEIINIFNNLGPKYLDEACAALAQSTPALSACLLNRTDISDTYVLEGLKSLSKLSKQRTIKIQLDFDMLGKLGPKARLDAMKQLLGLFSKWHNKKIDSLPFKTIPKREDISNFLFPCSIKYNKEVGEVMQKYDDITKTKNP